MRFPLIKVKECRCLTWQGWLAVLFTLIILFTGFTAGLYPFLAPEKPPQKGLMVIEGWIHDFALDEAVLLYREGDYSKIICTGVMIETGSYIQQFKSYPEMTAARLKKMGIPENEIVVTIADDSQKDRTYKAAVALREGFMAYNIENTELHLITTGPHGRRSRMLFKKAMGPKYEIGVTCLDETTYTPKNWFTCSEGVRSVIGELIAYTYAKLFFHP